MSAAMGKHIIGGPPGGGRGARLGHPSMVEPSEISDFVGRTLPPGGALGEYMNVLMMVVAQERHAAETVGGSVR